VRALRPLPRLRRPQMAPARLSGRHDPLRGAGRRQADVAIPPRLGDPVHRDHGNQSERRAGDGGDRPRLPGNRRQGIARMAKPSLTAAEAGVKITRHEESWEANLGTPTEQTYSFRDSGGGAFSRFNNTQIAVTEQILGLWADAAGITFTRVGAGYSNGG